MLKNKQKCKKNIETFSLVFLALGNFLVLFSSRPRVFLAFFIPIYCYAMKNARKNKKRQ